MELDLEESDGISILVLNGQLAAEGADQFREAIETLLDSGRPQILLDFTGVSFMDSAGIGELVAAYRTLDKLGGSLKILKPSKRIQESLSLTKLLPIFDIYEDRATAVASFLPPS